VGGGDGFGMDKTSGLDGSTMAFFQKCWEVLKHDIMAVFLEFHSRRWFENSLEATFVFVFPKKVGAVEVKDFWPISLVVGVYKIIFKVLATRFKSFW
jgi:hypothetical protein